MSENPDVPYLLLTPGPITTSSTVKETMLRDWCTWDDDYNAIVQEIRSRLVRLATKEPGYTSVLMQGSGTATVEAVIGTALPSDGRLLVIANGVYGQRIATIAEYLRIDHQLLDFGEQGEIDPSVVEQTLADDPAITHVAMVHCETTTGRLNPLEAVSRVVTEAGRCWIVDAMSSFGGIPMDIGELGIDFLISSANKCIQGVPGFGLVVARTATLHRLEGNARSLSLDLYDQWRCMTLNYGKWRFTSPTHVVRAFRQALDELDEEGGIAARHRRYTENHRILISGMEEQGFKPLLPEEARSPVITSFFNPDHADFQFSEFYERLKDRGFVIYPGKVSEADCFRIGTIGHVFPDDYQRLLTAVRDSIYWQ